LRGVKVICTVIGYAITGNRGRVSYPVV
jgi:hypothetical protein